MNRIEPILACCNLFAVKVPVWLFGAFQHTWGYQWLHCFAILNRVMATMSLPPQINLGLVTRWDQYQRENSPIHQPSTPPRARPKRAYPSPCLPRLRSTTLTTDPPRRLHRKRHVVTPSNTATNCKGRPSDAEQPPPAKVIAATTKFIVATISITAWITKYLSTSCQMTVSPYVTTQIVHARRTYLPSIHQWK